MSSLAQFDKLITKSKNKALNAAIQKSLGKVEYAVMKLMECSKIPMKIGNKRVILKPEQKLSIEYADKLRELTIREKLKGVWVHVAHEREAGWFTHIVLKRMGMLKGAPDYWHVWDGGCCIIELKVDGDLEEYQGYFKTWAWSENIPHAVCRSVESAIDKLREFGALND
jgi:hypothetical protein